MVAPSSAQTPLQMIRIPDAENALQSIQQQIELCEADWQKKTEIYRSQSQLDAVKECEEIQRFFSLFLKHRLQQIKGLQPIQQREALNHFVPFNSSGQLIGFLGHFFSLQLKDKQWSYASRNHFEKESLIFYDLYKIKKNIETIQFLMKTIDVAPPSFSSRFQPSEQKKILQGLLKVLGFVITKTLRPQYQKEIYAQLSLKLITPAAILKRRENNITYCYPHVLEKYDYRNLLFLLFFRQGLKMKVNDQPVEFFYNYSDFETLRQEYLIHWMTHVLSGNVEKEEVYKRLNLEGKSLYDWIKETPLSESSLLQELQIYSFNQLVSEVYEKISPGLKPAIPPMSEKHGELGIFYKNLPSVRKTTQVSLEHLRGILQQAHPSIVFGFKVTLITEEDIPVFYLSENPAEYVKKVFELKKWTSFSLFKSFVEQLMPIYEDTPSLVYRRFPKHDRILPYLIEHTTPQGIGSYLLIVGGEATIRPKGMSYSLGDSYSYAAYFVLASSQDQQFGPPIGQRTVQNKTFYEYGILQQGVSEKVIELVEAIKKKEFPPS